MEPLVLGEEGSPHRSVLTDLALELAQRSAGFRPSLPASLLASLGLMEPDTLRTRIQLSTEEEIRLDRLSPKSGAILEAVLYHGELPRGEAAAIVGGDRQARRVVSALTDHGVLSRTAAARRCASRSPLLWRHAGCRGCFRTYRLNFRWLYGVNPERKTAFKE